jgi:hypothetical protein
MSQSPSKRVNHPNKIRKRGFLPRRRGSKLQQRGSELGWRGYLL